MWNLDRKKNDMNVKGDYLWDNQQEWGGQKERMIRR
jgi:hypothetical protein